MAKSKSSKSIGATRKKPTAKAQHKASVKKGMFSEVLSGKKLAFLSVFGNLDRLGLTDGMRLCLDAGDEASYPGEGTFWKDTSGNGYNFFLEGRNGESHALPKFEGKPGGLTAGEFFTFNGSGYLSAVGPNPTWITSGECTLIAWIRPVRSSFNVLGCRAGGNGYGVQWRITSKMQQQLLPGDGSHRFGLVPEGGKAALLTNEWNYIAAVLAPGKAVFQTNNEQVEILAHREIRSEPASSALKIGVRGDFIEPMPPGTALAIVGAFDRSLSATELSAIFDATRMRFGI